jgi:peptide/nickel transport system substrate-binding protein
MMAMLWAASADAAGLRIASSSLPPGLGNPYGSIAQSASHTRSTILDGLTRIGRDGSVDPALALSWTATDARTWRFKLRPGVGFSNSEPFNAAAVKANIDWLKSPPARSQLISAEARGITEVRVIDELTVDFVTARTDAVLPKRLSMVMMVPPKAWAALGVEGFTQTPIGTGSYVLKDWGQTTGRTIIEANPKSWRAPKQITRVELIPQKEPVARLQALTSGRVDITQGLGPEDVAGLQEMGFAIHAEQEPQIMTLALRNVGNEGKPLHDVRVRQALNYAVDKSAIAEVILRGTAQAVGQGTIPGVTGYNPAIKPYPRDVKKAKELLAAAGYGMGLKLVARVQPQGPTEGAAIYQKVAADLAEAGVQLELRPVLAQDWVRMYSTGDWGGADIISATWNGAAYRDTIRAIETFSCRRAGAFFCAPEIEPLIDASNAALDPVKRETILQDIMARYHDLAPSIFLVNMTSVYAHTARVKGVVLGTSGLWFEQMELTE